MNFKNAEKILIVQIGRIGDMILTTPLFYELKRLFPHSKINVLASAVNKDIPLNNSSVDNVIVFEKSPTGILKLLKNLFGKSDIWIDTKDNYSRTSEYLVKTLKPKFSLGFNFDKKIFDIDLKDHTLCKHAVCINLSPINFLDSSSHAGLMRPSYNIPRLVKNKFIDLFKNEDKLNLIVNVSAGNKSRYLSKELWIDVLNNIITSEIANVYLIGLQKDKDLIDNLLNNFNEGKISFIETSDIIETSQVIFKSDFVLTPDTSVVHICSAFNKPVIAVYPAPEWNLEKFRPLSEINEVVRSKNENDVKDADAEEISQKVIKTAERIRLKN